MIIEMECGSTSGAGSDSFERADELLILYIMTCILQMHHKAMAVKMEPRSAVHLLSFARHFVSYEVNNDIIQSHSHHI